MGLQRYIQKRNFQRTPEPKGKKHARKKNALAFVIQKHAARRLHYDFRLELEGVLKSWAVPKGIPTVKGDKRLAMHVEDHPLEYGGFEGIIPEGNYGAGTVMLWDRGTWEIVDGDPVEALKKGKLHFQLRGKKLNGEWTLVRMRGREELGKEPWLLIKSGEDMKPISSRADNKSALSGKTMEGIAEGRPKVWHSNRTEETSEPKKAAIPSKKKAAAPAKKKVANKVAVQLPPNLLKAGPRYVEPMKALLVETAPGDSGWTYEIKWDGYRALTVNKNGNIRLYSRRSRDITSEFAEIAEAAKQIPSSTFVIDGEIVAIDSRGHPSFQLLQNCRHRTPDGDCQGLLYYVFDILNLDGHDLMRLPLSERKRILETLLKGVPDPIRFSSAFDGDPEELLAEVRKNRLEGLIGKRVDSIYEPGRRSPSWIKLKVSLEQEFVVGGYTEPKGSRSWFGSVLVGYYDRDKLRFAARVGTGFDTRTLKDLYGKFQKFRTDRCPFANVPAPPGVEGLTRAEMRRSTWLKPHFVAQVRFTEWTKDVGLRHPVFLGLRDDKSPREVTRELPQNLRSSFTADRSNLK